MIDINTYQDELKSVLSGLYSEREVASICKIYFEDTKGVLTESRFKSDLNRFRKEEPIQYITGIANFYGYNLNVSNSVLIPRPETEELAAWVLQDLNASGKKRIVDIGTGSGCIPLVVAKQYEQHEILAVDVSTEALEVAQRNFENHGVNVITKCLDFLNSEKWNEITKVDIVISNPPYISFAERHKMKGNVLLHEPEIALFSGEDPLIFYRAIAAYAKRELNENGCVYLELNEFYAEEVKHIFSDSFEKLELRQDMQGKQRMLKCSGKKS